ncbi:hypothetical protein HDZ31DRAFT_64207 [Schizophyllum fasciatum]
MLAASVSLALVFASAVVRATPAPIEKRGICDSKFLEEPAVQISQHGDVSDGIWWVRNTSDYFFDYVDFAPAATNKTQHIYHTWYLQHINTQYDGQRFEHQVAILSAIYMKTKAISTNGVNSLYGRQYTTLPDDVDGEFLANKGFAFTMSCTSCGDASAEACSFMEPFEGNCISTQANGTLTALPCDGSKEQLYDVVTVEV